MLKLCAEKYESLSCNSTIDRVIVKYCLNIIKYSFINIHFIHHFLLIPLQYLVSRFFPSLCLFHSQQPPFFVFPLNIQDPQTNCTLLYKIQELIHIFSDVCSSLLSKKMIQLDFIFYQWLFENFLMHFNKISFYNMPYQYYEN